jgi:hypothetical protein
VDQLSQRRFLIDTGASYSYLPTSVFSSTIWSETLRRSWPNHPMLGWEGNLLFHGRRFEWTFLLAAVFFPMVGVDFLRHYQLMVDPAANMLVDKHREQTYATVSTLAASPLSPPPPTPLLTSSITSEHHLQTPVCAAAPAVASSNIYDKLLAEFPAVENASKIHIYIYIYLQHNGLGFYIVFW